MKLLYLHNLPVASGYANVIQVLHMCHAFSELGHDVTLAVPDGGYDPSSTKELITNKINKKVNFSVETFPKITIKGRFSLLSGYIGVRNIVKRQNPDYCFVRTPIFVNATIKNNIPTIFESHSWLLHEKYKILDFFWKRRLIENCKLKSLVRFIAISNTLAELWKQQGVLGEKVIVLHDGVDSDSFSVIPCQYKMREELNLPLRGKIVVYAGSLYLNRGIENILKLAKSFPQVFFLVLGGPEERKNYYIKLCGNESIENITFLGYIPHHRVKDYLFAADVLLMIWTKQVKTINYCSPLKMFEYMAAGRIIVGHAFPTIKEVLKNGETAYLADPDSFQELKIKLALALEQRYPNQMAEKARRLALEKYSWKRRARVIMESIGVDT